MSSDMDRWRFSVNIGRHLTFGALMIISHCHRGGFCRGFCAINCSDTAVKSIISCEWKQIYSVSRSQTQIHADVAYHEETSESRHRGCWTKPATCHAWMNMSEDMRVRDEIIVEAVGEASHCGGQRGWLQREIICRRKNASIQMVMAVGLQSTADTMLVWFQ